MFLFRFPLFCQLDNRHPNATLVKFYPNLYHQAASKRKPWRPRQRRSTPWRRWPSTTPRMTAGSSLGTIRPVSCGGENILGGGPNFLHVVVFFSSCVVAEKTTEGDWRWLDGGRFHFSCLVIVVAWVVESVAGSGPSHHFLVSSTLFKQAAERLSANEILVSTNSQLSIFSQSLTNTQADPRCTTSPPTSTTIPAEPR